MCANEYPLTLSDDERARYQFMADEARASGSGGAHRTLQYGDAG